MRTNPKDHLEFRSLERVTVLRFFGIFYVDSMRRSIPNLVPAINESS